MTDSGECFFVWLMIEDITTFNNCLTPLRTEYLQHDIFTKIFFFIRGFPQFFLPGSKISMIINDTPNVTSNVALEEQMG